ncbi:transporter protein [Pyricularia oryzae]|nr:transporter protein [Pyricularia oryzae]
MAGPVQPPPPARGNDDQVDYAVSKSNIRRPPSVASTAYTSTTLNGSLADSYVDDGKYWKDIGEVPAPDRRKRQQSIDFDAQSNLTNLNFEQQMARLTKEFIPPYLGFVRMRRISSMPDSPTSPQDPASRQDIATKKDAESERDPDAGLTYPSIGRAAIISVALALAVFLVALDINIVATAAPSIAAELKSLNDLGWYGSAYLASTAAFSFVYGRLYTLARPKIIFSVAVGIFGVGSLIAGIAPSSPVLILGRAVQGLGTSGILSGALIIAAKILPLKQRSVLTGVIGAMEGTAMVLGPLLGGIFADRLSWRWCFYINVPSSAAVSLAVMFLLKLPDDKPGGDNPGGGNPDSLKFDLQKKLQDEKRKSNASLNVLAEPNKPLDHSNTLRARFALLSTSTRDKILLLDPLGTTILLGAVGGSNTSIVFVLGAVLFVNFGVLQYLRKEGAMIPPRLIKIRTVWAGFWFFSCTAAGLEAITYFLPLWYQKVQSNTAEQSGVKMLAMLLSMIIMLLLGGVILNLIGYYTPMMVISSILMTIGAALLASLERDTDVVNVALASGVFGAGVGTGFQMPLIAVQTVLDPVDMPIGTSIVVFGQMLGGALMLSVAEASFSATLKLGFNKLGPVGAEVMESLDEVRFIKDIHVPEGSNLTVQQILDIYNKAIRSALNVGIVFALLSLVGALCMPLRSVKKSREDYERGQEEKELKKLSKKQRKEAKKAQKAQKGTWWGK